MTTTTNNQIYPVRNPVNIKAICRVWKGWDVGKHSKNRETASEETPQLQNNMYETEKRITSSTLDLLVAAKGLINTIN